MIGRRLEVSQEFHRAFEPAAGLASPIGEAGGNYFAASDVTNDDIVRKRVRANEWNQQPALPVVKRLWRLT